MSYVSFLSPACAPPWGSPRDVCLTCGVKEGPLGVSPSLALGSPICLPPLGNLAISVPAAQGQWVAPICWDRRVSGQVFPSTDILGAGSSTPSTNLIRK